MGAGHAHALYLHEHSPVHRLEPEVKLASVLVFVIAVAITPRQAVLAFGIYAVVALAVVRLARIPLRFLALRLLVVLPFLIFALFIPFIGTGDRTGILWFAVSVDGLWAAWGIIVRATLGATASIILVASTEVPEILKGMARMRVPAIIVAIAGFMVRYLELIVEELRRMRVAMVSRGYQPRWLGDVRPIAVGAGAMFVRSYERGERVHSAMVSRGYTGVMPDLEEASATPGSWIGGLLLPVVCLVIAVLVLVAA
jgi:cobalt/nickel transport system permease protein